MSFRLNVEPVKEEVFPVEAEARTLTWRAWGDRQRGRLFAISELKFDWEDRRRQMLLWDAAFAYKAVGVLPPVDHDGFLHEPCIVGVWLPMARPGYDAFGICEVTLRSLQGAGVTQHRSPLNVGFVHVLPTFIQRYAERNAPDDSDDDTCGYCGYTYREGERPCRDCWRCARCCFGQGRYGTTCREVQNQVYRDRLERVPA